MADIDRIERPWRCDVTGNPVGTDTQMIGYTCDCQGCRAYAELSRLRAENEEQRKALEPFARAGFDKLASVDAIRHARTFFVESELADTGPFELRP